MEHDQQEQQSGEEGTSNVEQQRPLQETVSVSEDEAAERSSAAGDTAAVPSFSRRSLAGSAASKLGGGGGSAGSAPSSPKRASVGSVGSSGGGQASSPGKRVSSSSLASAPRVGAPLPPPPKASCSGSQQSSPRKSLSKPAKPERQMSVSENDAVVAMAENASEALSAPRAVSAECEEASRTSSVPDIALDASVEVTWGAAPSTGQTSPARPLTLAPRPQAASGSQPSSQPPPPNPASSAPSSATSTPVTMQPQLPPALSVGGTPMHLAPPLITASGSAVTAGSPASNPVSPAASMGGGAHVAGSASAVCPPSMPKLGAPAQAPPQDGVVLGVEALERQQAELERRRLQAAAEAQMAKAEAERQRALAQAQHLEQLQKEAVHAQAQAQAAQQQRSRTQSMAAVGVHPPTVPGGLPPRSASTPPAMPRQNNGNAEAGPQDDDTAPSSTCPQPTAGDGTPNQPRRTSSFGRFLKTPLKQLRQSSFSEGPPVASSANKHGSEALVVPPKDVNGLLEVEGLWQEDEVKPLVYGYLSKLGRNGQWQKRWFETDGMHLAYYKSRKRSKMLASLDLCHVGAIQIDKSDSSGCTFTIQVADRPYYLRAASEPLCKHWVINLNRVKEARIQVGGFQLVEPHFHHGGAGAEGADRQRTESDECMAPRVVMVANRTRTRAMAPSETEDAMMEILRQSEEKKAEDDDVVPPHLMVDVGDDSEAPGTTAAAEGVIPPEIHSAPPSFHGQGAAASADNSAVVAEGRGQSQALSRNDSPRLISQIPPVVLARWQKRRSTLTKLSLRLLRWARSMKMSTKCISGDENVVMGSPVHPPGRPVEESFGEHGFSQPGTQEATDTSDSSKRTHGIGASFSFEGGHAEWINKEKQMHIQSNRMHCGDADKDRPDDRGIQTVTSGGSASAAAQSAATGGGEGYESEEETRELS